MGWFVWTMIRVAIVVVGGQAMALVNGWNQRNVLGVSLVIVFVLEIIWLLFLRSRNRL